jgi:hypothetical protein
MNKQLQKTYLGKELIFDSNGWINATQTAKAFDKDIRLYTRSKRFTEYLAATCEYYGKNEDDFIKTVKGGNTSDVQNLHIAQGTYLHPFLAVSFARWINPRFAVWCDDIMRQILTGDLEVKYKELSKDYDTLEEKNEKLFEELRLYQRPQEDNETPEI